MPVIKVIDVTNSTGGIERELALVKVAHRTHIAGIRRYFLDHLSEQMTPPPWERGPLP